MRKQFIQNLIKLKSKQKLETTIDDRVVKIAKGEKGDQGERGTDGNNGVNGTNGQNGKDSVASHKIAG